MSFLEKRRRNINFPLLSLLWIRNFQAMSIYLINRLNFKHFIYTPFTFLFPSFSQSSCIFLIFVLSDQIVSTIFFLLKSEVEPLWRICHFIFAIFRSIMFILKKKNNLLIDILYLMIKHCQFFIYFLKIIFFTVCMYSFYLVGTICDLPQWEFLRTHLFFLSLFICHTLVLTFIL